MGPPGTPHHGCPGLLPHPGQGCPLLSLLQLAAMAGSQLLFGGPAPALGQTGRGHHLGHRSRAGASWWVGCEAG